MTRFCASRSKLDPIANRLIADAKARLTARSAQRSDPSTPVITREQLLINVNRTVRDVLKEYLGTRLKRVGCFVIDEGPPFTGDERLDNMLPDRVEHIEVLTFGRTRDSLMVRIYTRHYFPALMLPRPQILSQDELIHGVKQGRCR